MLKLREVTKCIEVLRILINYCTKINPKILNNPLFSFRLFALLTIKYFIMRNKKFAKFKVFVVKIFLANNTQSSKSSLSLLYSCFIARLILQDYRKIGSKK